jgi:hypothetical protein
VSASGRARAVQDLVALRTPLVVAIQRVRSYPWDSDHALATLTRENLASIVQRYLDDELSSSELEAWANAVEGRDDIDIDSDGASEIREILFEMATPEVNRAISPTLANEWLERLR